jgi:hypothetical protein
VLIIEVGTVSKASYKWYPPMSCSRSEKINAFLTQRSEDCISAGIFSAASEAPVLMATTTFFAEGETGQEAEFVIGVEVMLVCSLVSCRGEKMKYPKTIIIPRTEVRNPATYDRGDHRIIT